MSKTATWQVSSIKIPVGTQEAAASLAAAADAVAAFLDATVAAMRAAAALARAAVDLYSTLVNTLIDKVQNYLNDIRYAGVYVLVDYPDTMILIGDSVGESLSKTGNAYERAYIAGTPFDPQLANAAAREAADPARNELGEDLAAIASSKKSFARMNSSFLSFDQALERITKSFSDPLDHLRPQFSEDAETFGVVMMFYAKDVGKFVKIVQALTNVLALNDLKQCLNPGLDVWAKEMGIELSSTFDNIDWCSMNLGITYDLRNSGDVPNFVGRMTIQDLFPPIGELMLRLSEMVEMLRPNDALSEFINNMIKSVEKKAKRIQALAANLRELSSSLDAMTKLDAFSMVAVGSSSGNAGFIKALKEAKAPPDFTDALVVSVLLYAGGPGIAPLKLFFESK